MCIRTEPSTHKTTGFFVAVFEREAPIQTGAKRMPPPPAESPALAGAGKRADAARREVKHDSGATRAKKAREALPPTVPEIGSAKRKAKKKRKAKPSRAAQSVTAAAPQRR